MAAITRNLSDDWKVEISLSENFGGAVGIPERRIRVDILDRNHYDDPQHRTVWYKTLDELRKLRNALSDYIDMAEKETVKEATL